MLISTSEHNAAHSLIHVWGMTKCAFFYGYGDIGYAKECEALYDEEAGSSVSFAATSIRTGGEDGPAYI